MQISGSRLRRLILLAKNYEHRYAGKFWRIAGRDFLYVMETQGAFFIFGKGIFLVAERAPRGRADAVAMLLRKYFSGKKIQKIFQWGGNRIVVFSFPNGFLVVELFGKGNIAVLDPDYRVIFTLQHQLGKRTVVKGQKYPFPEAAAPWDLPAREIEKLIKGKGKAEIARLLALGRDIEFLPSPEDTRAFVDAYLRFVNTPETLSYSQKLLEGFFAPKPNMEKEKLEAKIKELEEKAREHLKKAEFFRKAADKIFQNLPYFEKLLQEARSRGEKRLKVKIEI